MKTAEVKDNSITNKQKTYSSYQIERFNQAMNNFVVCEIPRYEEAENLYEVIDKTIVDEIICVLENADNYPNDYNLKARTFTQQTQERIGNILNEFGIELYQKYLLSGSKDDIGELPEPIDYDYFDDEYVYIYPEFIIRDFEKFIKFLRSIERGKVDKDLAKNIACVINSIGQKVFSGFNRDRSDEELDMYKYIRPLYHEIRRLGLKDEFEIDRRCDYFVALRDRYLDKFKECVKNGYYSSITKSHSNQPMFFDDALYNAEGESEPTETTEGIIKIAKKINKDIQNSRYIFDTIKRTKPLAKQVTTELHIGINNIITMIKNHKTLPPEEKKKRHDQFNDYLSKIKYIDAQSFFLREDKRYKRNK